MPILDQTLLITSHYRHTFYRQKPDIYVNKDIAVCFQMISLAAQESSVSARLWQTPGGSISQEIGQQLVHGWLSAISWL